MAGYCYKYRDKYITLETGCGNPEYRYTVFTFKGKVDFWYSNKEDAQYMLNKVQEYIDAHYEQVKGCPEDCSGLNFCGKDTKF